MHRRIAYCMFWLLAIVVLISGCEIVRAGYSGVQQQQEIERQKEAAGIPAVVIPEGASTPEIIAYVGGSLAVLLSGLFLGKRYMPSNSPS